MWIGILAVDSALCTHVVTEFEEIVQYSKRTSNVMSLLRAMSIGDSQESSDVWLGIGTSTTVGEGTELTRLIH